MSAPSPKSPTLTGWLVRDLVILLLILAICSGLTLWQQSSPGILSATLSAVIGFISAYVLCYIVHEWGHLIGAKLADAHMPLYGYKGVLLGQFDTAKNLSDEINTTMPAANEEIEIAARSCVMYSYAHDQLSIQG